MAIGRLEHRTYLCPACRVQGLAATIIRQQSERVYWRSAIARREGEPGAVLMVQGVGALKTTISFDLREDW